MAEAGTYGGVLEIRLLYGLTVALVLTTFLGLAYSSTPDGLAMSFGYQAVSPFASYPGGSVILGVGIQNTGTAQERIIEMSITTDFAGPLPPPTQIPFVLLPGIRRQFDVLVQVPPATSVGGHGAEARVSYEYLDPATQQWVPSTHSPWIMESGVPVYESPSQKVRDGFFYSRRYSISVRGHSFFRLETKDFLCLRWKRTRSSRGSIWPAHLSTHTDP